jgi:uncharacterized protein with FMN-binding domain
MARKMPRQLVALSSSAIAAIYFAGLIATRTADAGIASVAAAASTPTSAVVSMAAVNARLQDGTYTGTGTSRRGNVNVAVTVHSGLISNVSITSVTTEYPVARIASLPTQVVSRQSAQVDNISGATYSAQAFRAAVQAALSKASS